MFCAAAPADKSCSTGGDLRRLRDPSDHHEQERPAQGLLALALQKFGRRFGITALEGGSKNVAEAAPALPAYGNEAPGMQSAMIWRPQGGGHDLAQGFIVGGRVANLGWTDPCYEPFVGIH